jgi:taurine dioxygenase/putative 2-oxoglutarate oxygenase
MALTFRPLHGEFAAEVVGAPPDLRVDDATLCEIGVAWFRYGVLVFRGLDMTPAEHVAFSRCLGPLHIMVPSEFNLRDLPEVWVVGNAEDGKPLGLRGAGMGFHTDGEDKIVPNAGSFLYAKIVPPDGGDTLFADMRAAYAALPDDVKQKIAGRRARFSRADMHAINYPSMRPYTAKELAAPPDLYHPLVRRNDKSGGVSLYIGRWACGIEGLPTDEGRASSPGCRNSRGKTALSTGIAGATAMRCCGTIAVPSIARRRSTRCGTRGSCTGRRSKAACRSWLDLSSSQGDNSHA